MSRLDILYAGLSAACGSELITPEKARARGIVGRTVNIDHLFEHSYFPISTSLHEQLEGWINIEVKTIIGMAMIVKVNRDFTIAQVKEAIEEADRTLPSNRQKLVFNSRQLLDGDTVKSLGIYDGDTIYLVLLLRGGGPTPLILDDSFLDPNYDFDFTRVNDGSKTFWRGEYEGTPLPYRRPCGWYRYAIKVLNKYRNNDWLGGGGIRTESTSGEWPVSYHGTFKCHAKGIVKEGFRPGPRKKFGKGVYSSPCLGYVEMYYATSFFEDGNEYKLVFQNRVNTQKGHFKLVKKAGSFYGEPVDYWISTVHNCNRGVIDIRPYGILIKKI